MTVRLGRHGHACIRLDRSGDALVIDPGGYSDLDAALTDVRAVLVTHEHGDHLAVDRVVRATQDGTEVWAPSAVVDVLAQAGAAPERLHVVRAGDEVQAGGFAVQVLGQWHATIHPDVPRIENVGYLVAGVLHPGDAYVDPQGATVDVLLAPIGGPWLRLGDVVDYVRSVRSGRVVAIHDASLSDIGRSSAVALLTRLTGTEPVVLGSGQSLDV